MHTEGKLHNVCCILNTISTTTLQVKQQLELATTEKEQILLELQAMTEESHKLMREKQQLQQELLVANTRLEDSQQQLQQQVSDITIPSWGRLAYS